MTDCKDIQKTIYESEGLHLDEKIMAHIRTCVTCKSHFDAVKSLDHDIGDLTVINPPRSLVENTIENIIHQPSSNQPLSHTRWASAFAASFVLLASISLIQHTAGTISPYTISSKELSSLNIYDSLSQTAASVRGGVAVPPTSSFDGESVEGEEKNNEMKFADLASATLESAIRPVEKQQLERRDKSSKIRAPVPMLRLLTEAVPEVELDSPAPVRQRQKKKQIKKFKLKQTREIKKPLKRGKKTLADASSAPMAAPIIRKETGQINKGVRDNKNRAVGIATLGLLASKDRVEKLESITPDDSRLSEIKEKIARIETYSNQHRTRRKLNKVLDQIESGKKLIVGNYRGDRFSEAGADTDMDGSGKSDANVSGREQKTIPIPSLRSRQLARQYLANNNSVEGVKFQPASGYWANTYVPGDPEIRLLENRLKRWDRNKITPIIGVNTSIEQSTEQYVQPFDDPINAALAVYLHADKSAIQHSSRLRVQVGLQASKRFSGHRPLMKVGVLLDTRNINDKKKIDKIKALLNALAKAKQPGDRFSLTVTGANGGTWIKPQDFRHGSIQIALNNLSQAKTGAENKRLELLNALALASKQVQQDDDPSASLGSSLILFISAASLDNEINRLEKMAHINALNGITMSVIPLGKSIAAAHIDRIVLSGQGHRRFLGSPSDAGKLIENELLASSRAIARAVRLRIRLSKGVKLIRVLDSYRLDAANAQRVREAEQSIDRRLSRNFGITADRGADEEGIQIVIPSFFAGDTHVVLLDVVAENPGSIVDVTVRYKDVLYLKNGVARANLDLPNGQNMLGPLERNVVKNRLALKLSQVVRLASDRLSVGDINGALTQIQAIRDLYQGMRQEVATWNSDSELLHDERLLNQYIALLRSPVMHDGVEHLADSLRYYGFAKLLAKVE